MKAEKILILAFATVIGITVAGIIFYFYQAQKTIPKSQIHTIAIQAPTPTPKSGLFLTVDLPKDEDVTDSKTIIVSGKTIPEGTIVITTDIDQQVVTPAQNGDFSANLDIGDLENQLDVAVISPKGETQTVKRTITHSTENF